MPDEEPPKATNSDGKLVGAEKKRKKKKKRKKNKHGDDASKSKRQKLTSHDDTLEKPKENNSAPTPTGLTDIEPPPSKKQNKKKKKKDRCRKSPAKSSEMEERPAETQLEAEEVEDVPFPYPTDPDDHCESPLQAYAHLKPLLQLLQSNGSKKGGTKDLRIYDPYYCNGAVIENLTALGFPSVYNKKEDCYQVWASESLYPEYDAFVTNPPYSGDHIEKLVQHITSPKMGNHPWFLLMPDWVHKKDYFVSEMKRKQIQPFYLVPKKRYVYLPPKNYRTAKKSDVHKKSSPFNSMWYIWGGTREQNDRLIQAYYNKQSCMFPLVDAGSKNDLDGASKLALAEACDLARSKSALRDLRRKVQKK